MAKAVITTIIDDLDGSTGGVRTVRFALDGIQFEIDLNDQHAQALRTTLATYIAAARPAGQPDRPAAGTSESAVIRRWARKAGFSVADRGLIARGVVAAFNAAHRPATTGHDTVLPFVLPDNQQLEDYLPPAA